MGAPIKYGMSGNPSLEVLSGGPGSAGLLKMRDVKMWDSITGLEECGDG